MVPLLAMSLMPRFSISVLISVTLLFNSTLAFATAGDEAKCRQWALEDGVPGAQIANYVRECSADQSARPEPRLTPSGDETTDDSILPLKPRGD